MATIVTRIGKGSKLTFEEGDANFVNLNNDKLESISEDTQPTLGGDLDVNNFAIVSTDDGNITLAPDGDGKIVLAGLEWPADGSGGEQQFFGMIQEIDAQRQPNTLKLDDADEFTIDLVGAIIRFSGSDATTAGLQEFSDYFIVAFFDSQIEISETEDGSPIGFLNDVSPITDLNYEINAQGNGGEIAEGSVLTYSAGGLNWQTPPGDIGGGSLLNLDDVDAAGIADGETLVWNAQEQKFEAGTLPPSGLFALVEDTAPQLGGDLDVAGNSIVSVSNGNITLAPNGTGKTVANRLNYAEAVHSLGTTSGTIAPDAANGNVQTITLSGNLTLNAFSNPQAGQSITLIVNTNGTNRTLTSNMKWADGDKELSDTNTTDIISIFYDGTNYWASLSKDFN